jgi:hypothetical protein
MVLDIFRNTDYMKKFIGGCMETKIAVFQGKRIRKTIYNNEWWFSVVDVVGVLTDSANPRDYWYKMKIRDKEESGVELSTICRQLKLSAPDGKLRETDCVNTKNAFRLIQSIPSKKAEPFKQWLAQVGYERIQEIENPELGQDRIKEYYEMKGYPKEWIDKRLRGIAIRHELTDEWKNRGVDEGKEFAILTNEITKATFGKTVEEYKEFKDVKKKNQNLRDHMTDWELILTMLGEKATTDITVAEDAEGFDECKTCAKEGGKIAHNTRKAIEEKTRKPIVSNSNFLKLNKETKKIESKKK